MNRRIVFLLLALIIMGVSGCAVYDHKAMPKAAVETASPAPNTGNREDVSSHSAIPGPKDAIVHIGDILEVSVAEDSSFNGNYEVRLGGYFILPAVGRIEATGLPLKEIEANVSKVLENTQLLHATVKVKKLQWN
jgi:protein involved in polysaccharide export with SLBB domain